MDTQQLLLSKIVETRDLRPIFDARITPEFFPDPEARKVFEFIREHHAEHGAVPTVRRMRRAHPNYPLIVVKETYTELVEDLQEMRRRAVLQDGLLAGVSALDAGQPANVAQILLSEAVSRTEEVGDARSDLVRLSDVEYKPTEWFWPNRIPRGTLTLLEGDPDVGKTTVALDIVARATRGHAMPDGTGGGEPANVLLLGMEDPTNVVQGRLMAAGADLDKVFILPEIREGSRYRIAKLRPKGADDLGLIESFVVRHEIALLHVDNIPTLVDGAKNGGEYRDAMHPLIKMAERHNVTLTAIRHLRKEGRENAMLAGGGFIDIIALARAGYVLARDPEDENTRVMACVKLNVAASKPEALTYQFVSDRELGTGRVNWTGTSSLTADELVSAKPKSKEQRAQDWLERYLTDHDRVATVKDVQEAGKKAGIADKTLRKAKDSLGVVAEKSGWDRGWVWKLPDPLFEEVETVDLDAAYGVTPLRRAS